MPRPPRLLTRGCAACLALVATLAGATPTDPTLVLLSAVARGGEGLRLLRAEGSFHAEDLVQLDYPLQILVRETTSGTGYVRYDGGAGARTGSAAALADGVDPADALALLSQGTPAPDAAVVFLGRTRLEVLLPASFPAGPAEVSLFVLDEGEIILSNAIPVVVEALP